MNVPPIPIGARVRIENLGQFLGKLNGKIGTVVAFDDAYEVHIDGIHPGDFALEEDRAAYEDIDTFRFTGEYLAPVDYDLVWSPRNDAP